MKKECIAAMADGPQSSIGLFQKAMSNAAQPLILARTHATQLCAVRQRCLPPGALRWQQPILAETCAVHLPGSLRPRNLATIEASQLQVRDHKPRHIRGSGAEGAGRSSGHIFERLWPKSCGSYRVFIPGGQLILQI